jgi:hypothetical protein
MSNLNDVISGATLYNGVSFSYVVDRFNIPNAAISLNNGYLQVPAGVYFNGDFTFIAWVNFRSMSDQMRIFDFGNGAGNENIILQVGPGNSFCLDTYNGGSTSWSINANNRCFGSGINVNQWYNVAIVLNGTSASFYLNGVRANTASFYSPNNVQRTSNFIGKSNWNGPFTDAIYDEIKIFRGAMSDQQVLMDYNTGKFCNIFKHPKMTYFNMVLRIIYTKNH